MNRIIKFRAWDKEHKELLPMDLFQEEWLEKTQPYWDVMQFTGLLDKNGKEIYGGDILKHDSQVVIEVDYTDYSPSFRIYPTGNVSNIEMAEAEASWDSLGDGGNEEFEVIGNIYENPELLK